MYKQILGMVLLFSVDQAMACPDMQGFYKKENSVMKLEVTQNTCASMSFHVVVYDDSYDRPLFLDGKSHTIYSGQDSQIEEITLWGGDAILVNTLVTWSDGLQMKTKGDITLDAAGNLIENVDGVIDGQKFHRVDKYIKVK